jgi:hypothetical protein
MTYNGAGL